MKRVLSYYYIPIGFFILLSLVGLNDLTFKNVVMTILASLTMGLLAGFVFHIAIIIKNKITH